MSVLSAMQVSRDMRLKSSRGCSNADAVVWVDIPDCDQQAVDVLSGVFGFHPIAVRDCVERNHVSKVHIYPEYVFSVLHAPKVGKRGHVHYVELDQFVGRNYLVTVHGPLNPAVPPEVAFWIPRPWSADSRGNNCTWPHRSSCRMGSCRP